MQRKKHIVIQNSEEWYELRRGRFTASGFGDLFSGPKTAKYKDAIYKPVFERLTGESPEHYYGSYMKRGHDLEPFAIEQYELDNFVEVEDGGFWSMGDWIGVSPDGLILEDGLFEGKAPKYTTHMGYLMENEPPKLYYWQLHGQMYVTDRDWVDFYSYHPGLKPLCIRVYRDEKIEKELVDKLEESIEKAMDIYDKLKIK